MFSCKQVNAKDQVIWGVSEGHHDAAVSVMANNKVLFAAHAERYSRKKNDSQLNAEIIREALAFGFPSKIIYYETPWLNQLRYFFSGRYSKAFEFRISKLKETLNRIDSRFSEVEILCERHHRSHAALGFYSSKFENAVVVTCDGVGEMDTLTVFLAKQGMLQKNPVYSLRYPDSVGIFFSAITKAVGLKPNEEEFILMGMASFGKKSQFYDHLKNLLEMDSSESGRFPRFIQKHNFHLGLDISCTSLQDKFDLAWAAQKILEEYILGLFVFLKNKFPENRDWIFSGGVALNCVLNSKIAGLFEQGSFWIFPNPGDAGSSLGAIASYLDSKFDFGSMYLGTEIKTKIEIQDVIHTLRSEGQVGVAQGRAEFGPRALGNRSLLADPRVVDIKQKMNLLKNREEFRPFAAVVLKEDFQKYFHVDFSCELDLRFMQFVFSLKEPHLYPGIAHIDGTARVQVVGEDEGSVIAEILKAWKKETGEGMLLNTSLNVKGEPLLNDVADKARFARQYSVKVF